MPKVYVWGVAAAGKLNIARDPKTTGDPRNTWRFCNGDLEWWFSSGGSWDGGWVRTWDRDYGVVYEAEVQFRNCSRTLPPTKYDGPIIFNMCTPTGSIESWIVAKCLRKRPQNVTKLLLIE
ncbi:hypothetical protein HOY80DRAFT_1068017 [Tuber brumale]|nr:hypothetical protein HOY80DRAFT_1068017 [Tuber brumale]